MKVFKDLALKFNFSQAEIFKLYLRQNGCDPEELWTKFDEAITTVVLQRIEKVIEALNSECKIFNCTNDNFFELVRFDFMIDDECEVWNQILIIFLPLNYNFLKPHVMEVNMSPNLTPAHEKYERNAVQYEQVIYNALQIVGGLRFLDLK